MNRLESKLKYTQLSDPNQSPQITANVLQAQSFDVEQHMVISPPKLHTQREIQIGLFVIVILFDMIIHFSPKIFLIL